jgi:hypothetical protein
MDLLDEVAGALNDTSKSAPQRRDLFGPFRKELAAYVTEMQQLRSMDSDSAMAWLSSVSARVLEMMYATLQSDSRVATKFRIEELIPLKDEIRFQFQVASRRQSVAQMEWDLVRGQET